MTERFWRDWDRLTAEQQARFRAVIDKLVADLRSGEPRNDLRVRRVEKTADVFEITWAPDGRATFQYGGDELEGEVEWRWTKSYRVWEANRKVFLYPENWVEPELRDDRTPTLVEHLIWRRVGTSDDFDMS